MQQKPKRLLLFMRIFLLLTISFYAHVVFTRPGGDAVSKLEKGVISGRGLRNTGITDVTSINAHSRALVASAVNPKGAQIATRALSSERGACIGLKRVGKDAMLRGQRPTEVPSGSAGDLSPLYHFQPIGARKIDKGRDGDLELEKHCFSHCAW
ncbi:hypothetical protein M514_05809, partial [Trichuris suis]